MLITIPIIASVTKDPINNKTVTLIPVIPHLLDPISSPWYSNIQTTSEKIGKLLQIDITTYLAYIQDKY